MNEIAMPGSNEPVDGSPPARSDNGVSSGEPDNQANPANHATGHAELRLSPSQLKIHKRLCDIDIKLARMYEGGLRVLQNAENPDRIAQSANSIRHITYHLSNSGKDLLTKAEEQDGKKTKTSNALQLEKLFDPLGGTRQFLKSTVYERWNKEFHEDFVKISHYEREITDEEYGGRLARFEEFLLAYVLPLQTEVYARLDDRFRNGPATANPDELKLLLSRNLESYRYFFRNADSRWLPFLRENGLLVAAPDSAEYLSRITDDENSEAVMGVIESMATSAEDWAARKGLLEAAAKMPPIVSRRIIPKLRREQWLETPYRDWITHLATRLFQQLVGGGYHFEGLQLAAMVIEAGIREPDAKEYYLKEFLVCLEEVPAAELPPFIRVLVNGLGSAIQVEEDDSNEDASLVWRPAIEDHEQNSDYGRLKCLLVVFLRDLLDRYADYSSQAECENAEHVFDGLLEFEKPYSIFARLRLYLFRKHGDLFKAAAERAAIEYFHQSNTWHEYALLLRERFGLFRGATRQQWLALLDSGPGGDQHRDDVKEWKAYRLAVVAHHLDPIEQQTYRELLDTAAALPHPDFQILRGGVWIGPTSPITAEDLATMSLEAIVEHLEAWEPSGDWFAPSREGLGRDLASAVSKRAELFSREALRFFSPKIRPVYVYHLLSGLHEAHRSNAGLDWAGLLALLDQLIRHAETGELPAFDPATADEHEWEYTWTASLRASITLVQSGLESNSWRWEDRGRLWRIIRFLCEHPDPSPEYEQQYGGDNMDPLTMSINTVRGRSFHALFQYVFWCDRRLNLQGEGGSRIPAECKGVLEAHLDVQVEPSLTIRAVYGHYWSWLIFLDKAWAGGLSDRLFPIEDRERRRAAWDAYVLSAVIRGSYLALKPHYERAISELRRAKKETRRRDPVMGLIGRIMAAYVYRIEDGEDSTYAKFFRDASAAQRGQAVSFAGRAYVLRDPPKFGEKAPEIDRLREFWNWRLVASNDPEELREFGWWAAEGVFDDQWMLERLIETMRRAGFSNGAGVHVLGALAGLATAYPGLCAEALLLIVKWRETDRWLLGLGETVETVVTAAHSSDVEGVRELAIKLVDELTKLGFERYRGILEGPQEA